jgi:hypothetical protein
MNATVEQMFELCASARADVLDPLPALAEDDRALARPLDKDNLLDPCTPVEP